MNDDERQWWDGGEVCKQRDDWSKENTEKWAASMLDLMQKEAEEAVKETIKEIKIHSERWRNN